MNHRISVIIPVYHGVIYLGDALRSVLDQTRPADEIIVIDDGSPEDVAAVVRQFDGVRYDRLPENRGIGTARNRGVELATGDLLAFLDADDYWMPDKLALQVEILDARPDVDMVFGQVQQFISPDLTEAEQKNIQIDRPMMPGIVAGALLIRRAAFDQVGGFPLMKEHGEFIDWYMRARNKFLKEHILPDVVFHRRIHRTNFGRTNPDLHSYLRVVKNSIDSTRAVEPLNPILEEIFRTSIVTTADGRTLPLRHNVDETSCYVLQSFIKRVRATKVLEIGFAYGISSMAIADAVHKNRNLEYHIVDAFQAQLWDNVGIENMRRAGYGSLYTLHQQVSEIALPMLLSQHQTFDFAFIDGFHTFDHTLVDFFYTNKMLNIGGIVILDDLYLPAQQRLGKHIATYPCYEQLTAPSVINVGGQPTAITNPRRFLIFRKIAPDKREWDWHEEF